MRCIVRVAVGTQPIRALFAQEKPPVPDAEWDEAGYVEQRLRSYAEALEGIALVCPKPGDGGHAAGEPPADGGHDANAPRRVESVASAPSGEAWFCCPRTGDCVLVEPGRRDDDDRRNSLADIERALRRVFSDAHAWRRHLLPAYFERHRAWRTVVGAPIQH
jgi:hypothetical protein